MLRPFSIIIIMIIAALPQGQEQAPAEALGGADPVAFVAGTDAIGKPALFSDFEGFRYLFISGENKKTFDANPARYAIQLAGSCARMGGDIPANPERVLVHEGRIYGFASDSCLNAFRETPAAYLPAPDPVVNPSAAETARAQQLLATAIERAGGKARFARLTGWEESYSTKMGRGVMQTTATMTLVDAYTEHNEAEMNGRKMEMSATVKGSTGLQVSGERRRTLHPGGVQMVLRTMHRHPMALLAAASRPGTLLQSLGSQPFGGTPAGIVRVKWADVVADLALTPDGTLKGVRYRDRMASGKYGTIERVIQRFETVDGFQWPAEYVELQDGTPTPTARALQITAIKVSAGQ